MVDAFGLVSVVASLSSVSLLILDTAVLETVPGFVGFLLLWLCSASWMLLPIRAHNSPSELLPWLPMGKQLPRTLKRNS